jgi:ribosomal protein S18 acetylase RimI-like enzyme
MTTFRYTATPHDPPIVRRIVESTGFFTAAEVDVAVELVDERLAKGDASGYHFIFAEDGGETIGYACYGEIACTVGSYDLYWIAVDRQHQSRGLGRTLVAESQRQIAALGGRRIYIETSNRPQYEPTRQFYLRCGYTVAAVLPDFYSAGDDKVILVKQVAHRPS